MEWLNKYTFPAESKFKDLEYAASVCRNAVRRTLENGTTTCMYFSTIHREASVLLAAICREAGQRAFVGKVNMDRNSPDFYVENTAESVQETRR